MKINTFEFAAIAEANWKANLSDMSTFNPRYTFYSDFSIADFWYVRGDKDAIANTYRKIIESWASSYEALTEIILVLNHKIWAYYDDVDSQILGISKEEGLKISAIYDGLWKEAEELFFKKYGKNDEAVDYYYQITD